MDCRQLHDRIEVLGLSPAQELEADVLQHLQDCSNCREEFRDFQDAWLLLPAALEPTPVSQELEDRLLHRISNAPEPPPSYSRRATIWKYAVAASVLFLLATITVFRLGSVGNGEPKVTDSDIAEIRSIAASVEKLNELERIFAAPKLKYVSLTTAPNLPVCYLIHDEMSEQFHFLGGNLKVASPANLWIWLLDGEGQKIASAPINLESQSNAGVALLSAASSEEVASAAITTETDTDPQSPSSRVVLRCDVDIP